MLLLANTNRDLSVDGFEQYRRSVNVAALRFGMGITVAVQVPLLVFEWMVLPHDFTLVQGLRCLWLGPGLLVCLCLRPKAEGMANYVDTLIWLVYAGAAANIVVVSFLHEGYESSYLLVLVLMSVGVTSVTLWRLPVAVSFAGAVYGLYLLPFVLGYPIPGSATQWIVQQSFVFGTFGVLLFSQKLRLDIAAADFQRRRQLERSEANMQVLFERVATLRQHRLTWLEGLARFLGHELRNQMVALRTSLELAEATRDVANPTPFLTRARRSLDAMRRLVDDAIQATSLEAALRIDSMEPVDLSEVVSSSTMLLAASHPECRLQTDIAPGVYVFGQEDRLAQMLDKLLENAVQRVDATGEIRVSLMEGGGGEVVLAVENDGAPLPSRAPSLFAAYRSADGDEVGSNHLGLGLFVAKVAAESHGGVIVARDPARSVGARFEVRIPSSRLPDGHADEVP